ncbi:helix-turn-helix transcriptional regulator [Rhizobium sp. P40RR-XXII]|uniref:AraC family transcriptional regulator n=1 Tax=Rhizobium sp. P40RR-XXII TaxID=2726739 RepID=UPI0014574B53|nr:AraC family transcriptional regulator [Rhizobium sp. P40RR-XXII]NLS20728.1 helix-turn-helix transcriptional regulator [Rhizobium sp. P40RR-XXII]
MSGERARDLHENVVRIDRSAQSWNGVTIVDVHEYTKGEVLHSLLNEEETGIAMAIDEVGGITEPRLKPQQACTLDHKPNHMTLVPRGMQLWGHATQGLHYSRYALLLFDLEKLEAKFQEDFDAQSFARLRMRFTDDRIHALVRMLIAIPKDDASMTLLGDSLTSAVFALLSSDEEPPAARAKLTDQTFSLVASYLQDQLPEKIGLRELSELAGMSQWHFCRAFKSSTGLSPYQWQLEKRLEIAQGLLLQTDAPLDSVAKSVGFCDAAHLSRAFKRRTGETPHAWRRTRR